ncbi:hypothetical protein [Halioxenophilus aromaticivorans]|uniref:Roadblock/LAMTOR2 domain-containing protein n=1 Tax=Halioxenophilus aromaticivorans TaxID=1306992 RepID=A0AAV3U9X2_9ALTE
MKLSAEQKEAIKAYLTNAPGNREMLESLLLATSDGRRVVFSNYTNKQFESNRLSAMAASLSGLSLTLAESCEKTGTVGGIVETEDGLIISGLITAEAQDYVLLGIFCKGIQHGMALWNFKNHQLEFKKLLSK